METTAVPVQGAVDRNRLISLSCIIFLMSSKGSEFDPGKRALFRIMAGVAGWGIVAALVPKPVRAFLEAPEAVQPTLRSSFLIYHEMSYLPFKRNLLNLIREGQQPISPDTAVNVINGSQTIPDGLPTFMVTCDDSLLSQYDSILRATEEVANETGFFVPVTFCAIMKLNNPTAPITELPDDTPMYNDGVHRYLTLRHVINLIKAGHLLANHTVNHAILPNLSEGARNAEVEIAEQRINTIYQMAGVLRPVKIIAYPQGRYQGQLGYIGQQGFDLGLSTLSAKIHTSETRLYAGRVRMS